MPTKCFDYHKYVLFSILFFFVAGAIVYWRDWWNAREGVKILWRQLSHPLMLLSMVAFACLVFFSFLYGRKWAEVAWRGEDRPEPEAGLFLCARYMQGALAGFASFFILMGIVWDNNVALSYQGAAIWFISLSVSWILEVPLCLSETQTLNRFLRMCGASVAMMSWGLVCVVNQFPTDVPVAVDLAWIAFVGLFTGIVMFILGYLRTGHGAVFSRYCATRIWGNHLQRRGYDDYQVQLGMHFDKAHIIQWTDSMKREVMSSLPDDHGAFSIRGDAKFLGVAVVLAVFADAVTSISPVQEFLKSMGMSQGKALFVILVALTAASLPYGIYSQYVFELRCVCRELEMLDKLVLDATNGSYGKPLPFPGGAAVTGSASASR